MLSDNQQKNRYLLISILPGMTLSGLLIGLSLGLGFGLSIRLRIGLFNGLMFGLIGGLLGSLIGGLSFSLITWSYMSSLGFFIRCTLSIMAGRTNIYQRMNEDNVIDLVEEFEFSFDRLRKEEFKKEFIAGLKRGLLTGVAFGLAACYFWIFVSSLINRNILAVEDIQIGWVALLIYSLTSGLIGGLTGGLIDGLVSGLRKKDISRRSIPNQGIKSFSKNILIVLAISILLSIILSVVLYYTLDSIVSAEAITVLISLISPSLILASVGNISVVCVQHLILRLALHRNNAIPWNYARFLNHCTERLLLQRVGGRYRFIHRLVQERFAATGHRP